MADIVFGDVAPSGKLPITFPKSEEQLPAYENYSMQGRTYRYMDEEPMYPFGYGLSYSKTKLKKAKVTGVKKGKLENNALDIRFELTNTGDVDIEDVVQIYLRTPSAKSGGPKQTLVDFKRVAVSAGATVAVEMQIPRNRLESVLGSGERELVPGKYELVIANAAPVKRSVKLGAAKPLKVSFKLKG